jgi:hypothetical protein
MKLDDIQGMNMKDSGFFKLAFGDLERLQYFWSHLPNKNPTFMGGEFTALHILASLGHDETFQFMAEKVDNVNPGSIEKYGGSDHFTPLFIANQKSHFGIIQIIQDKLRNAKGQLNSE